MAAERNSRRRGMRVAFSLFSYFDNVFNSVLNFLPPVLRTLYFKIMCREFGRRVLIDYGTYVRYPHKVKIGNDVAINRGCSFYPSLLNRDSLIVLRDRVVLGPQVTFYGAGQSPHERELPDVAAPITVESDVYIGGNSVIRYGVTIGEGAVVAAGSVVVKDVAPWTIVGGTPARFISHRVIQDEEEVSS
ncbi:MAG: acyltransferase [Ilumatobacteraceae bacterium]